MDGGIKISWKDIKHCLRFWLPLSSALMGDKKTKEKSKLSIPFENIKLSEEMIKLINPKHKPKQK